MVMIQDSNIPSAAEKPLRISGDPQKCQRAKEMVLDLLAEKEMEVKRVFLKSLFSSFCLDIIY